MSEAEGDLEVSILMIASKDLKSVEKSLRSLIQETTALKYELLVIDLFEEVLSDSRLKTKNIKFIKGSDLQSALENALSLSSGKYVGIIEEGVIVTVDWLSNLLVVFSQMPNTGMVGAKIIYEYGLLKQAGGVLGEAGSNVGEFDDPDKFNYNFIRESDCQSFLFLLQKQDLQKALEDAVVFETDSLSLSLSVFIKQSLKKKVYYQPLSIGILLDKSSESRNRLSKEAGVYTLSKPATPYNDDVLVPNKSILFIDPYYPTPDKDSGSRRLNEIITICAEAGFNVFFYGHKEIANFGSYYQSLINKGVKVVYKHFLDDTLEDDYKYIMNHIDFAWISRLEMNEYYVNMLRAYPHIKWINDTVDLHFLREGRAWEQNNISTNELDERISQIRTIEVDLAKKADVTIAITQHEGELLKSYGVNNTVVVPNIHFLKVGYRTTSFYDRAGICFIGGYDHKPNVDAVVWLVNEIMPIVWKSLPDLIVHLLGSNPPKEVTSLQSRNVIVPGYINDVSPYFERNRVFVAPLRVGAGMKGKIGHSMEYGLPVITTSIGAEGMDLTHNKNVLIADNAKDFANEILRLYQNKNLWNDLSTNSLEIIKRYTPENVSRTILSILK
ncbi:glycosyltransferase [Olivibacter jilunii]|uniref:glycosyltransferase n=1 Tax=Olivibacter jilunii TaxID=985016 RepID=UPI003F13F8E1